MEIFTLSKKIEFKKRTSLQIKFSIAVSLLIIFVGSIIGKLVLDHEREAITYEAKKRIVTRARSLAESSEKLLLMEDPEFFLCPLTQKILEEDKDLLYAVVVDSKGKIKGHPDIMKIGKIYKENAILKSEDTPLLKEKERLKSTAQLFHLSIPIWHGKIRLGTACIGFSKEAINKTLLNAKNKITGITVIILIFGVIFSFFLVRFIVRPINALAKGAQEIGKENFDYFIKVKTTDEIGALTTAFNNMAKSLKEKKLIKETFGKYIAKDIAEAILGDLEHIHLGGERRRVTILITDIHGFTEMSERLSAEEVVSLLNEYFTRMVDIVFRYNGTLDKFMGDALIAIYGAPITHKDNAHRAVMTAIEMRKALKEFNHNRQKFGKEPINVGTAIASGEVVAGNIGSDKRMDYTVIGANVNLAFRLQGIASQNQILLDKATYEEVKDLVSANELPPVTVKGIHTPVKVYEVITQVLHADT